MANSRPEKLYKTSRYIITNLDTERDREYLLYISFNLYATRIGRDCFYAGLGS